MLRIAVNSGGDFLQRTHSGGPLEIGRGPQRDVARLVIGDPHVSRDHLRIEELPEGRVRIENLSHKNRARMDGGSWLEVESVQTLALPVRIRVGMSTIDLELESANEYEHLRTIRAPIDAQADEPSRQLRELGEAPSVEVLTEWLERAIRVQRAAAGSPDFFAEAAKAVVELVGLDRSCVLLRQAEGWRVAARHPARSGGEFEFSRSVIGQVELNRRTFFESQRIAGDSQSLRQIEAVVASPILDERQQLIGILYGSREYGVGASGDVSALEAQFVQLLATAVGAGLARQAKEVEAARLRVQFEQFLSPVLASELERDPHLLVAREREITVLFADVRGFTGIAERMGAQETFSLMADVMDRVTSVVLEHGGTVIDYYGDGVAVMWNAPLDQPDHAGLACRAATELLSALPRLNEIWSQRLGSPLSLGIGIHTGLAQVGNSGSQRRLKYGPRGHTVNLASRLEQVTKRLGLPIVMSEETAAQAGDQIAAERFCAVRLAGVNAATRLRVLAPSPEEAAELQTCMGFWEARDWGAAESALASSSRNGRRWATLLSEVLASLSDTQRVAFDGVVPLAEK